MAAVESSNGVFEVVAELGVSTDFSGNGGIQVRLDHIFVVKSAAGHDADHEFKISTDIHQINPRKHIKGGT